MNQEKEPSESTSDLPIAGDQPLVFAPPPTYAPPTDAPAADTPPPAFAPPPSYAPPPSLAVSPSPGSSPPGIGQGPFANYAQGYLIAPPARNRRKAVIIIASVGTVVVLLVAGLVTLGFGVFRHLSSTANVKLIIPPPAAAGGLNQDFVDERKPQFQQELAAIQQAFTTQLRGKATSYALAVYSNAPINTSAIGATVRVVYVGLNDSSANYDTQAGLKDALAGSATRMSSVRTYPITSGPGNTSYGCQTGTLDLNLVAECAWTTDRTAGFLFEVGSTADVTQLAALEKKMEPDLVTG